MSLDFGKVEQGSSLNFGKDLGLDFGKSVPTNLMINLNWGVPAGRRSVDLDSCLSLITEGQSTAPAEKQGFFKRLFSAAESAVTSGKKSKAFVHCFDLRCGSDDGIKHHGDDTTGSWAGGEFIEVDLSKVGSDVVELVPSILSFSGDDMANLPFAHMKVYLGTKGNVDKPLFEVDLTDVQRGTMGVQFGKLVRDGDDWTWTTDIKRTTSRSFDSLKSLSEK